MKNAKPQKTAPLHIEENLARLLSDRKLVEARVLVLKDVFTEYKASCGEWSSDEEKDGYMDIVDRFQSLIQMATDFLRDLDIEIERIQKAILGIKNPDTDEMREAFEAFVLTDTAFSVREVGMMLYDFDQIITSMRDLISES